ncbi:MAG: HEAT repeat domain-containing protein [Planctomycetota bacterium]|jgi:sialidase-1
MQHRHRMSVVTAITFLTLSASATEAADQPLELASSTRTRCLTVLRTGLRGDDFWPAIHAAEGLTLGGYEKEVRDFLQPKLSAEEDDQRRCGIARELVRAGDRRRSRVMLDILSGDDDHGHIHAAESLYKVNDIGDGHAMRLAFATTANLRLRLMASAALAKAGSPAALQVLRETVEDDDPSIARLAAWVLGRIGDESDIPRLHQRLNRCDDKLARAFIEHALASLGDEAGQQALTRNLTSDDPAVRTYAAVFAGDAKMTSVAPQLIRMLDDEHPDAAIRAAQTLLWLSRRD